MNLSPQSERIPELDGLRGIAIGLVLIEHYLLYHASTTPGTIAAYAQVPFRLAWSGVDLFFVLSGFLIGGILLDARKAPNYFKVFYIRRFFRIIPLYAACLGGAFVLYLLTLSGTAHRIAWMYDGKLPWGAYLLFLQNFWMALFTATGAFPLAVTWSLAVEEQFYLTLPTVVRFFKGSGLFIVISIGVLSAPVLRMALFAFWPQRIFSWFMLMPCRADSLLLGVLGAMLMRSAAYRVWFENKRWIFHYCLFPVLLIGLAIFTLKASSAHVFPMLSLGYSWLALFYLSVLLYALLWRQSWISSCLRWKWLGWLGTIAYGTYLLHELVLGLVYGIIWSRPPMASTVRDLVGNLLALGLTLLICRLSWVYFEKPLVRIGHRWHYSFDSPENYPVTVPAADAADTATP